jgi:hypothetical protein
LCSSSNDGSISSRQPSPSIVASNEDENEQTDEAYPKTTDDGGNGEGSKGGYRPEGSKRYINIENEVDEDDESNYQPSSGSDESTEPSTDVHTDEDKLGEKNDEDGQTNRVKSAGERDEVEELNLEPVNTEGIQT